MKRVERAQRVLRELERRYKRDFRDNPGTALAKVTVETDDPFRVLISTILSQRTKDERTEEASARLFEKYDEPQTLAEAPLDEVTDLIRPAGFYRQKAAKIREVSRILLDRHDGKVPDTYEELMRLPQVGPKTANCVLVYGFGKPAIPVLRRLRGGGGATPRPHRASVPVAPIERAVRAIREGRVPDGGATLRRLPVRPNVPLLPPRPAHQRSRPKVCFFKRPNTPAANRIANAKPAGTQHATRNVEDRVTR